MLDFETVQPGITKAKDVLPLFKDYLGALEAQKRLYVEQEIEAGLGPEPTKTDFLAGEMEMFSIKKMSRFPHGATVVRNKNKGVNILSIVDDEGVESEYYTKIWTRLNMDRKMEIFKRDRTISGAGFFSIERSENDAWDILVKSPKNVTVFSSDRVNKIWGDFAIERFTYANTEHARFYDAGGIYTFRQDKTGGNSWTLIEAEKHDFGHCPIVASYKNITSAGEITGDLSLLKPIFDTLRQRTFATSSSVYWTGTRTFVIEGLDQDDVRTDADSGETYRVADRVMDQIRMTASGVILLPTGAAAGEKPTLGQTEEGNVLQLIEATKDALRDLASASGLPYHLFDGGAVPSTNEASIQAYMSTNDDKSIEKAALGFFFEMILTEMVFADTGAYPELNIIWAVSEQVSINQLADTVSKLAASGLPLTWIVRNVLAGYRPNQIAELLEELERRNTMAAEQLAIINDGV